MVCSHIGGKAKTILTDTFFQAKWFSLFRKVKACTFEAKRFYYKCDNNDIPTESTNIKKINITLEFVKCKYRLEVETSVAI